MQSIGVLSPLQVQKPTRRGQEGSTISLPPTQTLPCRQPGAAPPCQAWWDEDREGGSRLPSGNDEHCALLITVLFGKVLFVQVGLLSRPALGRPPWSPDPTRQSVEGCGAIQQQSLQDVSSCPAAQPATTFSTAALGQGMGPVLITPWQIPPPSPPTLTASSPTHSLLAVGAGGTERTSPRPPGLILHPCTWASPARLPEWTRSPCRAQGVSLKGTVGLRIALPRGTGNSGVFP